MLTVFYGSACEKSEVYFQDLKTQRPDRAGGEYDHGVLSGRDRGRHAVSADQLEGAELANDGRAAAKPAQENWKEMIPEGESRLEDFRLAGGKIIAQYSHNAASEMKVFQADGSAAGGIELPELGSVAGLPGAGKRTKRSWRFNLSRFRRRFTATTWREGSWRRGPSRMCRWTRARSR